MCKIFIIIFSFISINIINAQNNIDQKNSKAGLTEVEFEKAKEDYLKMTQTETYKANKAMMAKLSGKINTYPTPKELRDEKEWSNWITENLSKTKFKNVDEANKLRKSSAELFQKQMDENADLYKMIRMATLEQLHEILKPERAGRPF